jgi:hypothetical protein
MPPSVLICQRNNRHVVKAIDSTGTFVSSFGIWQEPVYQISETQHLVLTYGLAFPSGTASDFFNNIFICDSDNKRIVIVNENLEYESKIDVSIIGKPYSAFFYYDSDTEEYYLYVVGIYKQKSLSIAKISLGTGRYESALIVKFNTNVAKVYVNYFPMGASVGYNGDLLISNGFKFLSVAETTNSFVATSAITIVGETDIQFLGHIRHSNDDLYLNVKSKRGSKIIRVTYDSGQYINIGDSNIISQLSGIISEDIDANILVYDNVGDSDIIRRQPKILKYDYDLNFVEIVFEDTGDTIETDAYDVMSISNFNANIIDENPPSILIIDENTLLNQIISEV